MTLARFTSSNDVLDDHARLQRRYEEDGYLYFSDVLDKGLVAARP